MPIEDVLIDAVAVSKAALRTFIRDMDIDTAIVGDTTDLTVAVTPSPFKVVGGSGGISIASTDTAANTEGFLAGFQKDAAGTWTKYGVIAVTVPDRSATSGRGGVNIHATKIVAGVRSDVFGFFFGGIGGMRVFPSGITTADLPGDNILAVNGDVSVQSGRNLTAPQLNQIVGQNSQHSGLTLMNNSTQTSASERLIMGNNATSASFTIETFGGAHATKPSHVEIVQQANVPLAFGTNGAERLVIAGGGGVKINSLAGSGTRNVVVDASGNLTAP